MASYLHLIGKVTSKLCQHCPLGSTETLSHVSVSALVSMMQEQQLTTKLENVCPPLCGAISPADGYSMKRQLCLTLGYDCDQFHQFAWRPLVDLFAMQTWRLVRCT